jgi:hypothetical protein
MVAKRIVVVGALAVLVLGARSVSAQQGSNGQKPITMTAMDYIEIQQLYANYAHALDKGEADRFLKTFTVDGEFTGGRGPGRASETRTPTTGDRLKAMGSRGGSRHFTANLVITPTPDGAKGSCYLLLFNARAIPATITETAIYDDTLVKTPEGWKFKKRVVWRDDDDITPYKPKGGPGPATEGGRTGNK